MDKRKFPRTLALVFLCLLMPLLTLAQQGGRVTYVYDNNGRLRAVVLPTGEAAMYKYDAAGNIVSISRGIYTTVSIIEFTPTAGQEGTVVTLYGTGFGLDASQNTVSFNGTNATVTAASATHLQTTVPANATTGPITVTSPNGSATSSMPFIISAPPTITSFTPSIGAVGDSVTINGTDFSTTAADNHPKFNTTIASATSSTSTEVLTSVPEGATSGRISLTTPGGTAVSTGDFFVPPAPYVAADVDDTGRIAIGESRIVNINRQGKIALLVFDAQAGQSIGLQLSNQTFFSGSVFINKPDGSALLYDHPAWLNNSEAIIVPTTGTYTIFIRAGEYESGSLTLGLNDTTEVNVPIVPDGDPVTISITTPGRNARLTFDGVAGQRVFVNTSDITMSTAMGLYLLTPDGETLAGTQIGWSGDFFNSFLDTTTLPVTGRYSILIDPLSSGTGSVTAKLHNVPPDLVSPITPDGPSVPVSLPNIGQDARLTFNATAGQRMMIRASNSTLTYSEISVLHPDGSKINSTYVYQATNEFNAEAFLETGFLPVTGTYTVLINPFGPHTGNMTVSLLSVPADVTGTIAMDGQPVTKTTVAPGQNIVLTFSATAGQRASIKLNNLNFAPSGWPHNLYLRKPDGSFIIGTYIGNNQESFYDAQDLTETGTYSIMVDPSGGSVGSATVTLYDATSVQQTLSVGGPPATATITNPGQNAVFSFEGTAGQWLKLTINNKTLQEDFSYYAGPLVSVYRPDETQHSVVPRGNSFVEMFPLPTSGTYKILINPPGMQTGSITLSLSEVPPTGTIQIGGPPVAVTMYPAGRLPRLTFEGTAGQRVSVMGSNYGLSGPQVTLYSADGTLLGQNAYESGRVFVDGVTLPADGTYSLTAAHFNYSTGNITLALHDASEVTGEITVNGPAVTATASRPGQNIRLTFQGTAEQRLVVFVNNVMIDTTRLNILKPDGTSLLYYPYSINRGDALLEAPALPETGTYTITLDPYVYYTGSLQLKLYEAPADLTGTITRDGPPVSITTTTPGQNVVLSFDGTAGQTAVVKVELSQSMLNGCLYVELYKPDGEVLTGIHRCFASSFELEQAILPANGRYTIQIDPNDTQTGTVTVTLASESPPPPAARNSVESQPDLTVAVSEPALVSYSEERVIKGNGREAR